MKINWNKILKVYDKVAPYIITIVILWLLTMWITGKFSAWGFWGFVAFSIVVALLRIFGTADSRYSFNNTINIGAEYLHTAKEVRKKEREEKRK